MGPGRRGALGPGARGGACTPAVRNGPRCADAHGTVPLRQGGAAPFRMGRVAEGGGRGALLLGCRARLGWARDRTADCIRHPVRGLGGGIDANVPGACTPHRGRRLPRCQAGGVPGVVPHRVRPAPASRRGPVGGGCGPPPGPHPGDLPPNGHHRRRRCRLQRTGRFASARRPGRPPERHAAKPASRRTCTAASTPCREAGQESSFCWTSTAGRSPWPSASTLPTPAHSGMRPRCRGRHVCRLGALHAGGRPPAGAASRSAGHGQPDVLRPCQPRWPYAARPVLRPERFLGAGRALVPAGGRYRHRRWSPRVLLRGSLNRFRQPAPCAASVRAQFDAHHAAAIVLTCRDRVTFFLWLTLIFASSTFGTLVTAMVTPFTTDGEVDYQQSAELAEQARRRRLRRPRRLRHHGRDLHARGRRKREAVPRRRRGRRATAPRSSPAPAPTTPRTRSSCPSAPPRPASTAC